MNRFFGLISSGPLAGAHQGARVGVQFVGSYAFGVVTPSEDSAILPLTGQSVLNRIAHAYVASLLGSAHRS